MTGKDSKIFSIIMTVGSFWKSQWFLGAINSLRCQKIELGHIELILATDNREFIKIVKGNFSFLEFPLILIECAPGSNRAHKFRKAVQAAKGEFCCILDSDDILLPNGLQVVTASLRKYPQTTLFSSGHFRTDEDLRPLWSALPYPWKLTEFGIKQSFGARHFWGFRRELIIKYPDLLLSQTYFEDYHFWVVAKELGIHCLPIPRRLYLWRAHKESLTTSHFYEMQSLALRQFKLDVVSNRRAYVSIQNMVKDYELGIQEFVVLDEILDKGNPSLYNDN